MVIPTSDKQQRLVLQFEREYGQILMACNRSGFTADIVEGAERLRKDIRHAANSRGIGEEVAGILENIEDALCMYILHGEKQPKVA